MPEPNTPLEAAYNVAVRYLGYSARSRSEMEKRLERAGFEPEIIAKVISHLESRDWLDDTKFAHDWVEDRADRKRYGRRRLAQELRNKGIERETIDAALNTIETEDEVTRAQAAVRTRWDPQTLAEADFDTQQAEKRRMAQFLQRRGFTWDIISQVFATLFSNQDT